jgi:hypothetical protein
MTSVMELSELLPEHERKILDVNDAVCYYINDAVRHKNNRILNYEYYVKEYIHGNQRKSKSC